MASRPLPPGRRGRGPRVASGLHNLPEIKLLDVPETSSPAPTSSVSPVDVAVVDAPVKEKETTKSCTPEAPAPAQQPPVKAALHPAVFEPLSASTVDKAVAVDSPAPAPAPVAVKHVAVHDVIAKLEERQHVEQQAPTAHPYHSHGYAVHTAAVTAPAAQHKPIVKSAPATPAVLYKAPTVAPAYVPKTVAVPAPVSPAATIPPPTLSTPVSLASAPVAQPEEGESANLGEFHPFYLLLPVDSVPEVPESIECIYDDAALEMQKNVMKVIKKLLAKKDKMKLEDFKINSRLFGNNFMEPHEYLDSIVKDFGGIRALQLIPCLLMIQADFMKRSGLLLAARNYRMRNIAALEAQCQAMRAAQATPVSSPVPVPVPAPTPHSSEPLPVADPVPLLKTSPDAAEAAVVLSLMAGFDGNEATEKSDTLHGEVDPVEAVEAGSSSGPIAPEPKEEDQQQVADVPAVAPTEVVEAPAVVHEPEESEEEVNSLDTSATAATPLDAAPTSFENAQKEPEVVDVQESPAVEVEESHSSPTLSSVVGPIVDSAEDAIQSIHVPEPIEKSVEKPAEVAQPTPVVEPEAPEAKIEEVAPAPVEVAAVAAADAEFQSLEDFLPPEFREAFASSSGPQSEQAVSTKPPATVHSTESSGALKSLESASSSSSFAEAENLFGERFSTGSTSSDNAGNLFGESFSQPASSATSTGSAPAAGTGTAETVATSHPAPKRVHSQLLFGFATAGADTDSDSDSDDSDF